MTAPDQGYIVLALGPVRYLEMAANLAASIKVMDRSRPVCVVHDAAQAVPPALARYFDQTIGLEPDPLYPHVMNKLRLFDVSPYPGTMYVDADCLLVKHDVDRYWTRAATRPFSITGGRRTGGEWKGVDVAQVLRQEGIDYLIQMNAGVFYFDKSTAAEKFFAGLNEFYLRRRHALGISVYHGQTTHTDELYLGLFMGQQGMDTDNMHNEGMNSWMVATWRSLHNSFDPARDHSIMYKGSGYPFGLPFPPTRVTRISPTFAHFIGLKPRRLYDRLARTFRAQADALVA